MTKAELQPIDREKLANLLEPGSEVSVSTKNAVDIIADAIEALSNKVVTLESEVAAMNKSQTSISPSAEQQTKLEP